ncbi:MAG: hypothetical protein ABIB47_05575 [Candidatus Woesearchaeota archaeon]
MALFRKKKKVSSNIPNRTAPLPDFPRYEPSLPLEPELPKYQPPREDFSKFKLPEIAEPKMPPPFSVQEELPKRYPLNTDLLNPEREEFNPRALDQFSTMPITPDHAPTSPIFVKLADYKKSLANLRDVRDLLREADRLMSNIQSLKAEEDKQLSNWHQEINELKSKLLKIDKDLFEYK